MRRRWRTSSTRPRSVAGHVDVPTAVGDIARTLRGLADHVGDRVDHEAWLDELRAAERAAAAAEAPLLAADDDPIKPTRIYGELRKRLERDAVVICDGGDFVSYAGQVRRGPPARRMARHRTVRVPRQRPRVCDRGTGRAARRARSSLLLGDGAAGFSLMDVDTLVRHGLPVVMIVGNNGMWGLEKHPMQAIYGWDVACDLQPNSRYDDVVTSLGGGGETGHPTRLTSARRSIGPLPAVCRTWSTS